MLKRKKLVAGLLLIVMSALMVTPAYAAVGYTNGTIGGYSCRGSINTTVAQATATTSIFNTNAYLHAEADIKLVDALGNGTWTYLYATNTNPNGSSVSATKTKPTLPLRTLVCGKGFFQVTLGGGTWSSTKTSEP